MESKIWTALIIYIFSDTYHNWIWYFLYFIYWTCRCHQLVSSITWFDITSCTYYTALHKCTKEYICDRIILAQRIFCFLHVDCNTLPNNFFKVALYQLHWPWWIFLVHNAESLMHIIHPFIFIIQCVFHEELFLFPIYKSTAKFFIRIVDFMMQKFNRTCSECNLATCMSSQGYFIIHPCWQSRG